MCAKFKDSWGKPTTEDLCRRFFAGMDFCIEHDWPKVDTMKELFDADEAAKYGVYFADGVSKNQEHVCVLGDAEVHIYVPAYGVCDVYARHNSKVHLHIGKKAFCYVSILDNATVFPEDKADGAQIKSSQYGGTIYEPHIFDTIHDKTKKEA